MPETNPARARERPAGTYDPNDPCCKDKNGRGDGGRPGRNGRPRIERVPQGTWLMIRYDDADGGARPIPSGDTFWESPDIWFDGGDSLGNAIPGKPTPVHARIWNLGTLVAFPTQVYFAFVDAALGITWAQPKLISKKPTGANVPPWVLGPGLAEVRCLEDWVPHEGSTHACLLAMCSCAVSNDQPTTPWSPTTDRHVAQHNVNIATAGVGEMLTFQLNMTNVTAKTAAVQIAAQVAWVDARTPRDALRFSSTGVRNALAAMNQRVEVHQMRLLAGRASRLMRQAAEVRGTELQSDAVREVVRLGDIENAGRAKNGAIVIPSLSVVRGLTGYTPVDKVTELRPLQHRKARVDIKVPRPAGSARQLLVRLGQFENGFATGGYTVVVHVKG